MARQRGKKLVSTDELVVERNARARKDAKAEAAADAAADAAAAAEEAYLPPDPPPVHLPFLGARREVPAIADFATQMLMADTYARIAKDAGMLNVGMSEAQAKLLVLRGFEMGIAPLRALSELYLAPTEQGGLEIVEEATLMRARVAASGLGVIEPLAKACNAETATVRAIRHDHLGQRVEEYTYTLADATTDGLMLKRNWQSGANREALLTARATTKAARAMFSDVEGPRYTGEELGGGGVPGSASSASVRETAPPAPVPVSTPPAPVAPPAVAAADAAGASDAGGPHPPVAPPPGAAATAAPPSPPPPPSQEPSQATGPPPGATRQQKMAHYADVSRAMHRPWTSNVGMSRDAQPVPIITHGVLTDQITMILNYTVAGRTDFARADEALGLVIDHLGTLSIDTAMLPPPYCFFALTKDEAEKILDGLDAFARSDAQGDATEPPAPSVEVVADPPVDPRTVVQNGQQHSWVQATDYFEAVLRRVITHATRGDLLAMMHQATGKEFHEMSADELFGAAADLDRLGKNPTILRQAIDQLRRVGG
jgi:hypothetical protein